MSFLWIGMIKTPVPKELIRCAVFKCIFSGAKPYLPYYFLPMHYHLPYHSHTTVFFLIFLLFMVVPLSLSPSIPNTHTRTHTHTHTHTRTQTLSSYLPHCILTISVSLSNYYGSKVRYDYRNSFNYTFFILN